MELSYRHISERLCISVETAYNTLQLFQRTGSVDAKPQSIRPDLCKLDDYHQLYIISIVLDNPTLYLGEICDAIKDVTGTVVVPSTVCKLLRSMALAERKSSTLLFKGIFLSKHLSSLTFPDTHKKCWCGWMEQGVKGEICLGSMVILSEA